MEVTDKYKKAADLISNCDFLLFTCGAGWSADSGLPVYKDIGNVPAYISKGLTYYDVCQPHWMGEDPELFYGFWGSCMNSYRDTAPHLGYNIIQSWKNLPNIQSSPWKSNHQQLMQEKSTASETKDASILYSSIDSSAPLAGNFYFYTSNVDAHSHPFFDPTEISEIHGNVELWQCSNPSSCPSARLIRVPPSFRFQVDPSSLLAPKPQTDSDNDSKIEQKTEEENKQQTEEGVKWINHPRCNTCNRELRPAILMFNDLGWFSDKRQDRRFANWESSLRILIKEAWKPDENKPKEVKNQDKTLPRLVIVEVGCGKNVPTVRMHNEMLFETLPVGSVGFVRINLDFCKVACMKPEAKENIVEIRAKGLEAVTKIQSFLKENK